MKRIRRVLSLVLILVLVMAMVTETFAAPPEGKGKPPKDGGEEEPIIVYEGDPLSGTYTEGDPIDFTLSTSYANSYEWRNNFGEEIKYDSSVTYKYIVGNESTVVEVYLYDKSKKRARLVDTFGFEVTVESATSNRAPVFDPDVYDAVTSEETPVTIELLATDADDDALYFDTLYPNSSVRFDGNFMTYTPEVGVVGGVSFDVVVYDRESIDDALSDAATINITVNPISVNSPPEAVDDVHSVQEDSGMSVVDVLTNDIDSDGDVLTVVSVEVSDEFKGLLELSDGVIHYTPASDFSGSENFIYTVSDGIQTDSATVTVIVEKNFLYVALGDSIPYGSYVERSGLLGIPTEFHNVEGNYAQLLADGIIPDEFRNESESGYNTWELLEALGVDTLRDVDDVIDTDYEMIEYVKAADLITLCVGANDIMDAAGRSYFEGLEKYNITWSTADNGREYFETEWPTLIDHIESLNPNVTLIVMTIYNPYHDTETDISGKTYAEVDAYFESTDVLNPGINQVIRETTASNPEILSYKVVDIYSIFKNYSDGNPETINDMDLLTGFYGDNLCDPHPTQLGHDLIYQAHLNAYQQ